MGYGIIGEALGYDYLASDPKVEQSYTVSGWGLIRGASLHGHGG